MKFFYTATVIAAALLTSSASAQSLKALSPHSSSSTQLSTKIAVPEGRTAIMAAKGIHRIPFVEGANAARGGVGNDDCATAQAITMVNAGDCAASATVGNNSAANNGAVEPGCDVGSAAGYQDVWYTFNSGTNAVASITLTPDDPNTQDWGFVVYDACGGAEVVCQVTPEGPQQVPVTPNMDYYVRVYSNLDWGTGGPFTLCVAIPGAAPVNDSCTDAVNENLTAGSTLTFSGDNTGATEDGGTGFTMVWHAFTTTECTDVTINYCVSGSVFTNFLVNLAVQCPDFVTGVLSGTSDSCTVFFNELPAGTYYLPVLVDPADTPVGAYTVQVTASACATPPANDECAGAVELTPAADCVPVAGTTDGATESLPAIECNGFTSPDARDVWYSFTATETDHTVTIQGIENFDAVMELFSGSCADLTSIACGDPTFPTTGPVTEVTPLSGLTVGATYYIRVYDYAHFSTGHNFTICITTGLPAAEYCVPTTADPTDGDFIANVTLGSINNTTVGDNNYEDYTSLSTMLEQGGSYTLSITSGTYGEDYFAAWIDYNVDTTFQVTEKLGEFAGTTPGELITLSFTVPADATLGTTRLRVRCAWDEASMDPCEEYSYGEIEDYHVEITIPTGVREVNTLEMNVYPNPTTGDVTISGADLSGSVEFELTDMTGRVVYRHQQSMSAGQPVTLPLNGKLAQGTYTLRLISANGISSRAVMVK